MELEYVSIGKWITTDGKFAVVKKPKPINPMESSELPPKNRRHVFSIRDLRDRNYSGMAYELSPELTFVETFKEVIPYLESIPPAVYESAGMSSARHMRSILLG